MQRNGLYTFEIQIFSQIPKLINILTFLGSKYSLKIKISKLCSFVHKHYDLALVGTFIHTG